MQHDVLLAIGSGAKYSFWVYVEGRTYILCNFRSSLHTVSELAPDSIEEDIYCCGQAQDSFRLNLFCKSRNLNNPSSVYHCEEHGDRRFTLKIIGPESMAPFGDTMRFIDSNQADFSGVDHLNKPFVIEPLGGHISSSQLAFLLDDRVEPTFQRNLSVPGLDEATP